MYDMIFSSWGQCFTPEGAVERLASHERLMCPPQMTFPQYLDALQSTGQAQCTTVWTKGTVAYRCRTCQVNDSSAICVGCFLKGEHRQHDYVMYHSESGGCCDCGDPEAWQENGFCSAHRSVDRQEPCVPLELERPTRESVSNVLYMLSFIIGYIPETKGGPPVSARKRIDTAMIFLNWLKKLCSVDALRKIVCSEVVQMTVKDRETHELKAPLQILLKTFVNMPEEIMEGETTLFLQMLYNPQFKQRYSEELMTHYQTMIESVVDRNIREFDPLVNRFKALDSSLERVMVQLFNVPNMELIRSKDLLKLFVMVFGKILKRCLISGTNVVNVRDPRIESKMYLRPQGDLRLIVAHQSVAQLLLEEQREVFMSILDVLVLLQWMNPYWSTKYVDFEQQNEWTLAIQLEMNTMAIVFQIVSRCFSIYRPELEDPTETSRNTLLTAADCTLARLQKYLKEESTLILFSSTSSITPVSLHIPLHRTLSAVLAKLVLLPWKDAKDGFLSSLNLGYSEQEVLALMEHPLRIMVWMAQIRANRWADMSDDFSRLELIYRGSFWHDQSMDMDILLLQFCAVARENMESAVFLRMAERFELKELVSTPHLEHEKLVEDRISLLQDFIRLVLLVVRERRNTGMKEEDCLRYDVIQWLCVKNQTYSQLCRALSAIPVDHQKLTEMLEIVAHFHHPKVQERGFYELKTECWQEFDPLFAHFYSNELVDAQERAVQVGKLPHYWRIKPSGGVKPPYNRLINLLHTEECHQLLWNVLNYVSALVMNDSTATASENLGVIALQMMGLALQDRRDNPEKFPATAETWQSPLVSSHDIFINVHRKPEFNQYTGVMDWGISQSESLSILDLLRKLQDVTNAPRLVDSVHYVMHLLSASPYIVTSGASPTDSELILSPKSHDRVYTTEDDERLLKKQRQEAIMAQFKAKQNAFLEQFEVSDDDESGTDNSTLEAGHSSGDPSTEFSSTGARNKKSSLKPIEVHECAFCRSECGGNDKSTGWIAFVQRYNMPKHVIKKREDVVSKEKAESIVKMSTVAENGVSTSGPDAKQLVVYTGENMIDHVPTEHVRCCGHQMHQECFQSYHASLVRSHCDQIPYEGKGIIELPRIEFLCPICRRLANVLLPVVHQGSLSRLRQACVDDDLENQREHWMKFWDKCKNLRGALDQFAVQSLNVRSNFVNEAEAKDLPKCPVLWEVFASNITHCEVETREESQEVSSSSAASNQSSYQRVWGGDAGHWIAIQELGKLAMVSNTLDKGQELASKRKKIEDMLTKISQFLRNRELSTLYDNLRSIFTSVHEALVRLQNTVEHAHHMEEPKHKEIMDEEIFRRPGKVEALDRPIPNGIFAPFSAYNIDVQQRALWTSEPPMPEYYDARGMPEGMTPGDDMDTKGREYATTRFEDISFRPTLDTGCLSQLEPAQIDMEWSSSLQNSSLFDADPFRILIVLLSAFPGWPKVEEILLLVKFSYTVALTQVLLACSELQSNVGINTHTLEKDWGAVVRYTCLPFLRRAALLVQIITGEDCKQKYTGSGRKVMDASYLLHELGLEDSHRIFSSKSGVGVAESSCITPLLRQLRLDDNILSKESKLTLMEVPKELHFSTLPLVYQELLLRSITDKCNLCGKLPSEPAVCLVCGIFFCCSTECCVMDNIGECSRHAESEGSGIGIYLLMRSTQLVLIRGGRVCMAPSLYLDQHGEGACGERQDESDSDESDEPWQEDTFLRRSQLLHLSDLRLNEVRRLWLTAAFDYDTHILHSSQLSPGTL
ncbi:hypothetical protein KC19_9G186000 [Ceratodon purpureus]|uniref:E3 ubiquitin-protein ligase n=1 Tax=Ceratodon purpureus TaxID=3225 RepID=A0A8T0GX09_CERPU|nr:hypothetical protein KC19_9G186000 [Ceratodon purpureus]